MDGLQSSKDFNLLLPESLDIDSAYLVWDDLRKKPTDIALIIDFSQVRNMDSAGISLIRLLSRHFPEAEKRNVGKWEQWLNHSAPGINRSAENDQSKTNQTLSTFLGGQVYQIAHSLMTLLHLIADSLAHISMYVLNRQGVQKGDFTEQLYFMGYKSFSITSIIAVLIGLTISMTTAAQLHLLGGDIYLPTIVGFAMIKELVPIMTGIILAGKIGAAITAEIATMKVMEEVDALYTMGIDPIRFLMVPRMLAITAAVPLLLVCADFIGLFACIVVGKLYSSIPATVFLKEMLAIISLGDFMLATLKTVTFGWAVVLISGSKGLHASGGAEGVGLATTNAVLVSITSIIVIDCIFALVIYF